ncbi:MAG: methyltransferase domain-containing protein [Candidatus Scalindua sp.]|nr:methyltransferase domain-containing protein [Candidatus Scalindua sp.]
MKSINFNNSNLKKISKFSKNSCQVCGSNEIRNFHEIESVPANSCILLSSREEAIDYPKGKISLGACEECGFISNIAYNPKLVEYSDRYEETQGFSPTFKDFHRELANYLIDRYNLHDKHIIEIGCGKGEFLSLLCELGGNRGVGFDPAYDSDREQCKAKDRLTFIKDFYSEKYSHYSGDFIVCKMTLEHIHSPFDFVARLRRLIGDRSDTIVFFQVPDITRILHDCAFEDFYYEHCSYFSAGSLARLFRKCGFNILSLTTAYNGQYLMIEAKPANGMINKQLSQEDDMEILMQKAKIFSKQYKCKLDNWHCKLQEIRDAGKHAVLWGSGSKGVSFLTLLKRRDEIEYVVDINPHKHGFYMAGTGQSIVSPDFLIKYRPDIVIVMNSIYRDEIQQELQKMGLCPELLTV